MSETAFYKKWLVLLATECFVIDIHCVREFKRRPVQQTRLRQALISRRTKERGNPLTFSNSLGEPARRVFRSRLDDQSGLGERPRSPNLIWREGKWTLRRIGKENPEGGKGFAGRKWKSVHVTAPKGLGIMAQCPAIAGHWAFCNI